MENVVINVAKNKYYDIKQDLTKLTPIESAKFLVKMSLDSIERQNNFDFVFNV